jgi:hypothetical protein
MLHPATPGMSYLSMLSMPSMSMPSMPGVEPQQLLNPAGASEFEDTEIVSPKAEASRILSLRACSTSPDHRRLPHYIF